MSYPENSAILSWLALEEPEPVLEPHLPIIDPHHHLWDLRSRGAANSFEQQLYLCEDLVAELRGGGHNVVRSRHRPVAQRARTLRPGATVVADGWVVKLRGHTHGRTRCRCRLCSCNAARSTVQTARRS